MRDKFCLEKEVAKILIQKKLTISVAESCSGGLLSHRLTNIPGSSKYFVAGFITYSNKTKERLLRLDKKLLKKYGAVSKEVALEMAKNVRGVSRTDIGLSITGIAGPKNIENKPLGEIYIGLVTGTKTVVKKYKFSGTREEIKYKATTSALNLLKDILISKHSHSIRG